MQVLTVKVSNNMLETFSAFLKTFPSDQVSVLESQPLSDWSFLEEKIQQGIDSGISKNTHSKIIANLKQKYV